MTIPPGLDQLLEAGFEKQMAFSFARENWAKWTSNIPGAAEVVNELPASIDRTQVAEIVEELIPSNVVGAFTATMVWGHGFSGYGAYRTAAILTNSRKPLGAELSNEVVDKLQQSIDVSRTQGVVEGYRYLNNADGKIRGLGSAFFTKWLYFVTARGQSDSKSAAPVLDALVIQWLKENSGLSLRARRTADYGVYVDTLTEWGRAYGLSAAKVEEGIFRIIRNDAS